MKKIKLALIAMLMILALTLTSCDFLGPLFGFGGETGPEPKNIPAADESDMKINNMRLGDPMWSHDKHMSAEENYLISRDSYVLSYNNVLHIPNWVSWHIEPSHLGGSDRPGSFKGDPMLPDGWERVVTNDYTNSGFDRGHMCPNADRNGNPQMQADTFYMTNIVPQTHANNGGPWKDLEGHIQGLVSAEKDAAEAYVIAGTWGVGGEGVIKGKPVVSDEINAGPDKYGHEMTIRVPAYTWKVAVVIPNGQDDINRINSKSAEVLAVLMPNITTGLNSNHFEDYIVSVDFIEEITGYDFFANILNNVEDKFEMKNSGSVTENMFRTQNMLTTL